MGMKRRKTFKAWIKQFKDEDSAIGDLAADIWKDSQFPNTGKKEKMEAYLRWEAGASQAALDVFEKAYGTYYFDTEMAFVQFQAFKHMEKYKVLSVEELEDVPEVEWTDKEWQQFYGDVLEYHKDKDEK